MGPCGTQKFTFVTSERLSWTPLILYTISSWCGYWVNCMEEHTNTLTRQSWVTPGMT